MAQLIRNMNDLSKFFNTQVKTKVAKAMDESIMPECEDITKKHIEKEVYDSYSPTSYIRSDDLLNSLLTTKPKIMGEVISSEVYHDDALGHHYSVITGDDIPVSALAGWINKGQIHNFWNNDMSYPFLRPAPYFKLASEEIERKKRDIVTRGLRKQGLKVIK